MTENEGAATIGAPIIDMIDALMIVATAVTAAIAILSVVLMPYSFLINEVVIPLVADANSQHGSANGIRVQSIEFDKRGDQLRNQMETIIGSELEAEK